MTVDSNQLLLDAQYYSKENTSSQISERTIVQQQLFVPSTRTTAYQLQQQPTYSNNSQQKE
ncbi:hypothetical protein MJO28_016022 [Puccinia striiformis f. sp. tritici]|uniref:Uncharacterized protein n=1 Tax=Puccinia striiformis f. sp. tritici TaxID=168172 RepID=A0ACC0DQF7_9BASI|nr:hypothetical protein MJO28_016022 [Puccinia striiformis f. sp. tritici]